MGGLGVGWGLDRGPQPHTLDLVSAPDLAGGSTEVGEGARRKFFRSASIVWGLDPISGGGLRWVLVLRSSLVLLSVLVPGNGGG